MKTTIKKYLTVVILVTGLFTLTACGNEETIPPTQVPYQTDDNDESCSNPLVYAPHDPIRVDADDVISIRLVGSSSWIESDYQVHFRSYTIYYDGRLVVEYQSDVETMIFDRDYSTNESVLIDLVELLNEIEFFNMPNDMSEEAEDGGSTRITVETEYYIFSKGGMNVSDRQFLRATTAIHNAIRYWPTS